MATKEKENVGQKHTKEGIPTLSIAHFCVPQVWFTYRRQQGSWQVLFRVN